jgi:hypothetical protein
MNSRRIAMLLLGCLAGSANITAAQAQMPPNANAQWRIADTTLFDLIQNGYAISAVTSVAARNTGLSEDTYVLQKNNSVFRCVETRAAESGVTRASGPLRCAELVKPYRE